MTGSGQGVQGTADQAHIVYRAIDGDADVIVKVLGMWTTGSGESGLMLRPSLDANSPVVYIGTTNRNGFVFASRPLAGAVAARSATPDAVGTGWLRLSRQGDLFSSVLGAGQGQLGSGGIRSHLDAVARLRRDDRLERLAGREHDGHAV